MNKVVVKSLIGQNGESLGAYVDYGDFCKMQREYEEQIEKMKCCYNCKYGRIYFTNEIIVDCLANKVNPNNKCENCDKWELAE